MKAFVFLALVAIAVAQTPTVPLYGPAWWAGNFTILLQAPGQYQKWAGSLFFQQDNVPGVANGFNRTANIGAALGYESSVGDWDGKMYGAGSSIGPAIYFFTSPQSVACDYCCQIFSSTECDATTFCDYDYENNAKYIGDTTFEGTPAQHFVYGDVFGTTDFYVDKSPLRAPLYKISNLTLDKGMHPQMWYSDFHVGVYPSDSVFNVPGVDYCPLGDPDTQCSDSILARVGLRHGKRGIRARK